MLLDLGSYVYSILLPTGMPGLTDRFSSRGFCPLLLLLLVTAFFFFEQGRVRRGSVSEGGQGGSTSSIPHPSAKQHQYSGQYSASWRAREEQERRRKGDSKISISQHPIEVRSQKKYILESYTFLLDFTASCLLNLVARLCSRSPSSSCPSSSCPPSGGSTWRPYVNRRPAPRCRPPSRSRSSRRLRHGRHRRG